ncbi:MAG: hypothetical protein JNN28_16325 [Saprospiraceae bacterium]|nr:hypothetical protein [Saprospiraceae bacterium]
MKTVWIILLLGFWNACTPPVGQQPETKTETTLSGQAEAPVDSATATVRPPEYTGSADSTRLGDFSYVWYLLVYGTDYHWFQKQAVMFPFQGTVIDSLGNKMSYAFQSMDALMAWRQSQGEGKNNTDLERIIKEGYPHFTIDSMPFGHLEDNAHADSLQVSYYSYKAQSDYHFVKKNGVWKLRGAAHRMFSSAELAQFEQKQFEYFLLRYMSDPVFCQKHTRSPIKYTRQFADMEPDVSYKEQRSPVRNDMISMAVYQNGHKGKIDSGNLYQTIRSEGGACGWNLFRKTGSTWMKMEQFNCSN